MCIITDQDIIRQHDLFMEAYAKSGNGSVTGESFLRKALPVLEQRYNRTYPYVVRIPKSLDEMLQGDFSPAREIVIEKPFEGPYGHVWFGDSSKGVMLLTGYVNGDSRYVSDVTLGDKHIHAILAGATGQGKSVTLNSIIYGACALYAPWEMTLTLSDAKIVEFKSIAMNNPMPQIETVAATEDVDYLLSVLENKVAEMNKLNSVFTKAQEHFKKPVKKIEEFREVTGLNLPQNIMIFDEFQTMFTKAKKLAPQVTKAIDAFARLGRNTGYHLLLASQELGTDLPKNTIANMTVRAAMGCQPEVSDMILGNDGAAANLGEKGKLIINLNSANKSKEDNINVRVPYIDPITGEIASNLIEHGKQLGVAKVMRFYDEAEVVYQNEYPAFISRFKHSWRTFFLGKPSFIMKDADQCVKMTFDGKDRENLCVLSAIQEDLLRQFLMLKYNALQTPEIQNFVICANSAFEEEANANELSSQFFFKESDYENSQMFKIARSILYRRILCLKADELVFKDQRTTEDSDVLFYSVYEKGSEFDTLLYRSRFCYLQVLINTDPIISAGLGLGGNDDAILVNLQNCIKMYQAYGADKVRLTSDKMSQIFVWVLGIDRILGLGRDSNSKKMESFKKLLQDCNLANMRFFVFSSTFEEMTALKAAFRWFILDKPMSRDISKIGAQDCYPDQIGSCLSVLFDANDTQTGCKKYKKMFYEGEMP